ncbi:MAG: hypothetical protein ABIO99_09355 [Candidatus Limnocylindria bacterium]
MNARTRWLVGGALALSMVGAGVGIGLAGTKPAATPGHENATGGAENEHADADQPLTGSDRERAEAAALESVGGGTVTGTEVGDGGAAFGVQIRRDDGTKVEVRLDAGFTVIGTENDDD